MAHRGDEAGEIPNPRVTVDSLSRGRLRLPPAADRGGLADQDDFQSSPCFAPGSSVEKLKPAVHEDSVLDARQSENLA